jgi:hypothetical protein
MSQFNKVAYKLVQGPNSELEIEGYFKRLKSISEHKITTSFLSNVDVGPRYGRMIFLQASVVFRDYPLGPHRRKLT